ncbi:MAG TPA: 30S ribosomal protein S17 [bacterium]|nr:30S ribosomal protein S17 [bacterium]
MINEQSDIRGSRKNRVGTVISDAMEKTIVVQCQRSYRHPLYQKVIKTATKFYAHDEKNECKKGDVVKITSTRPLSKLKRWRLVEVVKKSEE